MSEQKKTCQGFSHPNLAGNWWGCCQCNTANGDIRFECKQCGHPRCGEKPKTVLIPYQKEDGTIVLQEVKLPKDDKEMN